jgi:hypothetical protein
MLGVPIMAVIAVGAKVIGHKRELFTPLRISVSDRALSLQELLAEMITQEVAAFSERQSQQQLRQVLTKEGMETGLTQGKISSGEREVPAVEVNVQDAIAQAIQGFRDGLYYVFIDDIQYENLDTPVALKPESQMLFLRLVPLVGG